MGLIKLNSLDDYARYDADVEVTCRRCGRVALFDARSLVDYFRSRGLNRSLEVAKLKFRCAGEGDKGCGSRDVKIRARPRPNPTSPEGAPKPRAVAPPGVDPVAWARADERERKRLIRQARG